MIHRLVIMHEERDFYIVHLLKFISQRNNVRTFIEYKCELVQCTMSFNRKTFSPERAAEKTGAKIPRRESKLNQCNEKNTRKSNNGNHKSFILLILLENIYLNLISFSC